MSASASTQSQASQTERTTKTEKKQPVRYSPELARRILEQVATGRSLNSVCHDDGMPDESSVREWALDDLDGFAPKYTRARELQQLALIEAIQDIAEEPPRMMVIEVTKNGSTRREERVDPGAEMMRKTRIDTRKWVASKILPKVYGDRVGIDLAVAVDPATMSSAMLAEIAARGIGRLTIDGSAQETEAAETLAIECVECAAAE